jgi:putative MFS transporter
VDPGETTDAGSEPGAARAGRPPAASPEAPAPASEADRLVARMEAMRFFLPWHGRIAAILGTGTFFNTFDGASLGVALTVVVGSFHASFVNTGLLLAATSVGNLVGAVVFGLISERAGRKAAFVYSMALFGALSLASAFSWSVTSLGVIRTLQGIGLGGMTPVASGIFNEFVRGRTRGLAVTLYQTIAGWGFVLAPLTGVLLFGTIGPELGWRVMFGIGAVPLVIGLLAQHHLPESPRWLADQGRLQEAERIVSAMEGSARARGMTIEEPRVRLRADVKPTRFAELLAPGYRRRTVLSWTLWFTTFFIVSVYTGWLPSLYVRVGHLEPSLAALLSFANAIAGLAMGYATSLVVDRAGRRPVFLLGYGLAIVGAIVGMVLVTLHVLSWQGLFAAGFFMVLGIAGCNSGLLFVYTPEMFPTRMRVWATATSNAVYRVASIISSVAIGALLGAGLGISSVFLLLLVIAAAGAAAVLGLGIETKRLALEEISQ